MKALRVIVIGGGRLGQFHAAKLAARPDVHFLGIVEPVAERRLELSRQGYPVFADRHEVPEAIQAAVVTAPTTVHGRIVCDLLSEGIDVLVEKPIASTTAEARQMVALAHVRHRILQVGHIERFNPVFAVAQQHATSLWLVEATRCGPFTGRSLDVGVVLDLMIHDLDLILTLSKSFPAAIAASGRALLGRHEDVAEARIVFENGCTAVLHASRVTRQPRREMKIWSKGAITHLDFATGKVHIARIDSDIQSGAFRAADLCATELQQLQPKFHDIYLPEETIECEKRDALAAEVAEFLECVETRRRPVVDATDGLAALQSAEAIVQSITTGESIYPLPATRVAGEVQPIPIPPRRAEAA